MRVPSPATVIALVALFVALGGTTWAAVNVPKNSVGPRQLRNNAVTEPKLARNAVTGAKVAADSLTGAQIDESTLGTVPDASKLGGDPASSYRDACPGSLFRAPNSDVCFDQTIRTGQPWADAAATCARAGLRLPTEGELAEVFDASDAGQTFQWTSTVFYYRSNVPSLSGYEGMELAQNVQRQLLVDGSDMTLATPFRCVTTVRNG